jgi:hypothetical protein
VLVIGQYRDSSLVRHQLRLMILLLRRGRRALVQLGEILKSYFSRGLGVPASHGGRLLNSWAGYWATDKHVLFGWGHRGACFVYPGASGLMRSEGWCCKAQASRELAELQLSTLIRLSTLEAHSRARLAMGSRLNLLA